ncbi:MAG: hypothetical protein H6841_10075 [Planctomycetes bacterium]|nr:hypothetical protein [Planctomycetota bacterium]MCB9936019.1 hypothetical protein [Planctomycetota bacterium]
MRLISLVMLLACVLAVSACGGDEPVPPQPAAPEAARQPAPATDAAPATEPAPEPAPKQPAPLLPQPQPEKPDPAQIDYIAEARRCLAGGDTEGYRAALKGYNEVLARGGGGLTVTAVTATSVTYRTADGQEYTTTGWHDALD